MKRREFFKNVLAVTGATAMAPMILFTFGRNIAMAEGGKRGSGAVTDMVDPNEVIAKAVTYVEDANKNPKSAGNKCSTCTLFVKAADKNGKQVGACALFPKKFVLAMGFCNSWTKKS